MSVSKDTVIYANFGTRKRVTTAEETNKVTRSGATGPVLSPAAQRVWSVISKTTDDGRITRGRQYARAGHVVGLDVRNGAIHGRVAGSQNEPFTVLMQLPYRSNDDLARINELLARTPNALRNAHEGHLSEEVLDLLFAPTADDLRLSCSCPDSTPVCKHVVAVADRLASRIDADASVVFAFRGLNFLTLEQAVLEESQAASQDALVNDAGLTNDERNDLFWKGRQLPDLPRPKVAPALEDSDPDLLRKAMRAVSHTNVDLLRSISDIEDMYHHLTTR